MRKYIPVLFIFAAALVTVPGLASECEEAPPKDPISEFFQRIKFGPAAVYVHDLGKEDRFAEDGAKLVNGIVRIEKYQNRTVRGFLETHIWVKEPGQTQFGHGPFVAFEVIGDDPFGGAAVGYLWGIKRIGSGNTKGKNNGTSSTFGFNIGVGIAVHPNARVLGDGLTANEPLPMGEMDVRT